MKTLYRIIMACLLTAGATVARAAEEAAEKGGGGIIPENYGLQIWTLVTFIVLFVLLAKFAFGPIAAALDKRGATIKASIDEAEKVRTDAKKLMDDYQKQLAEARNDAKKLMDEGKMLGENIRKEVVEKANAEASALLQRSQEEIQRQKEKGIQELKDTVASLSVQIAAKVIEKEVNETVHRQLVDNFIKDLTRVHKA